MSGLRQITKKLQITEQLYVEVTKFDFQQQLLSILRDKELMRSSNLVNLVEYDNINSQYTSEMQDSEWFHNAQKYYDEVNGLDDNRITCCTILIMDKTHGQQRETLLRAC